MKVYAIRHIPTGRFMPVPTGKNGSGSSYWDPVDIAFDGEGNVTTVPRLFPLRRSASSALTQWLRGRHVPVTSSEYNEFRGIYEIYTVGAEAVPDPSRKADDVEIVAFELVEVGK